MWATVKNGRKEALRQLIEGIYAIPNLAIREVGSEIPLSALNFIDESGLKPRDAFHAAIMRSLGLTEIVSDDHDFDKVKRIRRIEL
ncbi:type II toxin-antitoxin system VapC family toxin [Candidatus Woesearchaeota archaeon]|nr:type II toxin-antitoxin system VapC family toxin [Candidatus Woesearchaeota archaeon]